jgi:hypothetical protein
MNLLHNKRINADASRRANQRIELTVGLARKRADLPQLSPEPRYGE